MPKTPHPQELTWGRGSCLLRVGQSTARETGRSSVLRGSGAHPPRAGPEAQSPAREPLRQEGSGLRAAFHYFLEGRVVAWFLVAAGVPSDRRLPTDGRPLF